jgi:hypothetical protein
MMVSSLLNGAASFMMRAIFDKISWRAKSRFFNFRVFSNVRAFQADARGATGARCSKRTNCWLRCTGGSPKGFDTRDLKEAKVLLEELAAS